MTKEELVYQDIKIIAKGIAKEAKAFEGKTILISGGSGFLGSYFVATLMYLNDKVFAKPAKIIVLDNHITSSKPNVLINIDDRADVEFIECDVRQPLPTHLKADFVIHAAGLASPYYYGKYPLETIEVAVNGTKNFLEFAHQHKVKSMLYFSSSEIYGDPNPNSIPTPETYWGNVSSIGPRACYDESKRLGETLCMVYFDKYEVPIKIVRPFNVYGPGMSTKDYRVVPTFMVKALKGESLPVHDKGNQTRTFCYITDAMQGYFKILASKQNGEIYNVGKDDEEITMVGLASIMVDLFDRAINFNLISYPKSYPAGEPQRRAPDLTKIRTQLGYEPTVDLKTGLGRTMVWYREILKDEKS